MRQLFSYPFSDVNHDPPNDLMVRSDEQEHNEDIRNYPMKDIDTDLLSSNKDLLVYFIHGNMVYYWK